jgi:hypothetical protein
MVGGSTPTNSKKRTAAGRGAVDRSKVFSKLNIRSRKNQDNAGRLPVPATGEGFPCQVGRKLH